MEVELLKVFDIETAKNSLTLHGFVTEFFDKIVSNACSPTQF